MTLYLFWDIPAKYNLPVENFHPYGVQSSKVKEGRSVFPMQQNLSNTGWVICRCTLCCVSKNRNKGLILCTTMCYSCQVAYRSELSQTARISLLVYERNSCRASSFQCIYPCFNKSFINGWVLSETQNGMFTKNAATVLAQFRLNSVWLSKWHTAKHDKESVRLFRKCEKSLKVSESDEMWHDY